ncbi:hypothetical protein [Candidatus Poriferisodalis sp.]|uniref:hypothetical protein n=1 Tax=Candidatus Poriferisodalis sp. TaxID=3101277 RepID=UPI003B5C5375
MRRQPTREQEAQRTARRREALRRGTRLAVRRREARRRVARLTVGWRVALRRVARRLTLGRLGTMGAEGNGAAGVGSAPNGPRQQSA